jgi:pimeloyl-ACP methyl ester carboxylesterase
VPGCEVVDLGDAGHSSYFEIPHQFNDVVQAFLKKVETS